jgi:glycosyltransferase 2 family protein
MWRFFLKVSISAALITWLLSRTPVAAIGTSLSSIDLASLVGASLLAVTTWLLSALRLWFLAPEFQLRDIVRMTFVAIFYGTVLPGQVVGDVMKAYGLSHGQSAPGQAAAITLIDRVVATFALFLLGACAAPSVERAPRSLMFMFALAAAAISLGMLVVGHPRAQALFMRRLGPGQTAGFRALAGRLVDGLNTVLQHPRRLIPCFLCALGFHGLCVAIHVVLGHALGIDLSMMAWCLVYSGIALLLLLPISFAGLGLREGGYVGLLGMFDVAATQALSLSLVFFAYTLFGALLGWIAELKGGRTVTVP